MYRFVVAASAAIFACAPAQALEIVTRPSGYTIAVMRLSTDDPASDDFDPTANGLELNVPFTANMTLLNGEGFYRNYLSIASFKFSVTEAGNYSSTFGGQLRSYDLEAGTVYDLAELAGEPILFAYQYWSKTTPYLYKTGEFLGPDASPYRINVQGITLAFTDIEAVPEPATWAMMMIGFGAVGVGVRRRHHRGAVALG